MSSWDRHLADARTALRRGIQDAALRLIHEKGMPHTTMSAVAEEAGVSRQTLYNHYPDLEEIVLDAARIRIAEASEIIAAQMAAAPDVRTALSIYILGMLTNPDDTAIAGMTGMPADAERQVMEMLEPLQGHLADLIRRGIDDGTFRPELDPDDLAEIVFHMLGSGYRLVQAGRDPIHISRTMEGLILRAISA